MSPRYGAVFVALLFSWTAAVAGEDLKPDITTLFGKQHVFFEGDPVGFFIRPQQDSFLVVIYQSQDALLQIYPGSEEEDGPAEPLKAGKYHRLPPRSEDRRWTVSQPFGCDRVWAFATRSPPPRLPGRWVSGTKHLESNIGVLEKMLAADQAPIEKTSLDVCTSPRNSAQLEPAGAPFQRMRSHVPQ